MDPRSIIDDLLEIAIIPSFTHRLRAALTAASFAPCFVNVSASKQTIAARGACLTVASQIGIPDHFILTIAADHLRRTCRVVWRKDDRIGIVFD